MSVCKKSAWKTSLTGIVCGVAFLALPVLASARPKVEDSQIEKKTIQLDQSATVDGKTLQPGEYRVVIDGDKASFERDGKTIVTASCDWRMMNHRAPYSSETFSENSVLQELEFAGSNQALDLM